MVLFQRYKIIIVTNHFIKSLNSMLRSYAAVSPLTPDDSQGPLLSGFSQLNLTCALGVGGAVNILAIYHSQAFLCLA